MRVKSSTREPIYLRGSTLVNCHLRTALGIATEESSVAKHDLKDLKGSIIEAVNGMLEQNVKEAVNKANESLSAILFHWRIMTQWTWIISEEVRSQYNIQNQIEFQINIL